jgi:hypothetical protein
LISSGLAITLLPSDLSSSEAIFDLYQSYRNALDRAAEEGFQTLAFIHPTMSHLLGELAVIRTALSTIGDWLGTSYYRDQVVRNGNEARLIWTLTPIPAL